MMFHPYGVSYFVLWIVDDNGLPLPDFEPVPPVKVGIAYIHDAPEGFSDLLTGALISGIPTTVAEVDFGWGVVICHLPQVADNVNEELVQQVIFTCEDQFFELLTGHTDGPPSPANN